MKKDSLTLKMVVVAIWAVLGFMALHIPLFQLAGSSTKFTAFDFFAPALTGFLGLVPGFIAIILTEAANLLTTGHVHFDVITIVRVLTPLAGALYFSSYRKMALLIPAAAMILFWLNPVGRSVWFYALYWLVPFLAYPWSERWLPARALGAAFTAHALGGAVYLYFVHLPAAVWLSLIPVVATERIAMAAGITLTYLLLNNLLAYLSAGRYTFLGRFVERRFVWITR